MERSRGRLRRSSLLLLVLAVLITGATGIASPASAATTYHASCYQTGCQEPPNSFIYMNVDCTYCTGPTGNPPEAYVSYQVQSNTPQATLTSLTVHTTAGSFSVARSALSNCYYPDSICHFKFKGNPDTADLYGQSGASAAGRFAVTGSMSPGVVPLGGTAHLTGSVSPASPGATVGLQRYYSSAWHAVSSLKLNSSSAYSFGFTPSQRGTYTYRVYKPASGDHAAGASPTSYLYAGIYRVSGNLSTASMAQGGTAHMGGSVAPSRPGQQVILQGYWSSAWHTVAANNLSSASGYNFAITPSGAGSYIYRVYKPGDSAYGTGSSPNRTLTVS